MEKVILLVDSHHGIYMAQSAIELLQKMDNVDWGTVTEEEVQICLDGPDNEDYVEVINDIFDDISITIDGTKYGIAWNEDLWLVSEHMTEEDWNNFQI